MIDTRNLELAKITAFITRYFQYCKENTGKVAYEMTENDYKSVFGETKYSSYETFRVILSRWNAKNC